MSSRKRGRERGSDEPVRKRPRTESKGFERGHERYQRTTRREHTSRDHGKQYATSQSASRPSAYKQAITRHSREGNPNEQRKQDRERRIGEAPREDGKHNIHKKRDLRDLINARRRVACEDKSVNATVSYFAKGSRPGNTNQRKRKADKISTRKSGRHHSAPNNQLSQQKRQPGMRREHDVSRKHFQSEPRVLDHEVLKILRDEPCVQVVNRLNENMSRLKDFLSSAKDKHISDEFIFDLICVLAKACDAPTSESTNSILVALKGSVFLNVNIPTLLDRVQAETTLIDAESRTKLIQGLITIFFKYMRHLPSSYADLPREQLQKALDQLNIERKDELQKQLDAFKQERDEVIREERQRHGKRFKERKGEKPPNDFREIPVCPTSKEVVAHERPFLRKNITKGRYEDTEHYLDVQFRLFREDFLEPLREGIYEITHNIPRHQCNQSMKRFNDARIVGKELTKAGIAYKVQFDVSKLDTTRLAHSKQLTYGSFLCLSNDNFQTMLFATVANRDELGRGRFDVLFVEGQDILGIEKRRHKYLVVESPAFFVAYRHVLEGLKELDEESLPFTKYLVECSAEVDPPKYLQREGDQDPIHYDLRKALDVTSEETLTAVPILQPEAWPSAKHLSLNNSQLEALKTALTTEFSVIQGPPGTGKTYVGAKIVQCLLENRRQWDPEHISPMLMVCYTNHALDQFLEKVAEFLRKDRIIRVGGRCKSKFLEECNVKRFTGRYRRRSEIENWIEKNGKQIRMSQKHVKQSEKLILKFDDLVDFINDRHVEQLVHAIFPDNADNECRNVANTFKLWLCDNKRLRNFNQRSNTGKESAERESHHGSIIQEEEMCDGVTEDDVLYDAAEYQTWSDITRNKSLMTNALNSTDERRTSSRNEIAVDVEDAMFFSRPAVSRETRGMYEVSTTDPQGESCMLGRPLILNSYRRETSTLSGFQRVFSAKKDSHGPFLQHSDIEGCSVQLSNTTDNQCRWPRVFSQTRYVNGTTNVKQEEAASGARCSVPNLEVSADLSLNLLETGGPDERSQEEPNTLDGETIALEEADLIRDQRCIEGEEERFQPLRFTRLEEETSEETGQGNLSCDMDDGWIPVSDPKSRTPNIWQQGARNTSKDACTGALLGDTERGNDTPLPQTPKETKKGKKKRKHQVKIEITEEEISQVQKELKNEDAMTANEAAGVDNVWLLSSSDRLRMYGYWLECYRERYKMEIQRDEKSHDQLCSDLEVVIKEEEEQVLRRATVVGMTTTCAARYHSTLQRIAPKIVVIEEAAEVMEAHILTSLSRDTEHTILIGDHKQLRPKATVYELAQKYNLEISLFERMVTNNMDCKRLSIQHRMRPEIAELTKKIYDHEIIDHESVCRFKDISGVAHNLFFINHCQPEELMGGLQSHYNSHEAEFLVKFCDYLLLQGYKREQITILTMYTGQLLQLIKKMPRSKYEGVKVCAVDNFQGEENDIILLSLVRSNTEGRIGFVKDSNRICVALSRARQGLYCIGNFNLLSSKCKLWKEICDDMKKEKAIGETLQLVCERHKNVNEVRSSNDFERVPYGGCGKPCEDRLNCGHVCDKKCHPDDLKHRNYQCRKLCLQSCPNEHQCQLVCHYPVICKPCSHLVTKTIPQCGHKQTVPCGTDVADFVCLAKCEKNLECGHNCKRECGRSCTQLCTRQCDKELPCGHSCSGVCFQKCSLFKCEVMVHKALPCGHQKTISCYLDPGEVVCNAPCERHLVCGHQCPEVCSISCQMFAALPFHDIATLECDHEQLFLNPSSVTCQKKCNKKCERGHPCQKQCHVDSECGNCNEIVNMTIPTCKHNVDVPCHRDVATVKCGMPCERLRDCEHPCHGICGEDCVAHPCTTPVNRTLQCTHSVVLPCHRNPEEHSCEEKVEVELLCGHKKPIICSTLARGNRDESCDVKELKELPCKHTATLPCHKNPEEYRCKEKVEVKLQCGHTKFISCSKVTAGSQMESCDHIVQKELPCKHKMQLKCSENEEKASCNAPCEKSLSCGHPCPGRCIHDCSGFKCTTNVQKTLPCWGHHQVLVLCSEEVSQMVCQENCTRNLTCGHPCPGKCLEECSQYHCQKMVLKELPCPGKHLFPMPCCDNPNAVVCEERCNKSLECGHQCPGQCIQDCRRMKCFQTVEKTCHCGQMSTLLCIESKTAICKGRCVRRKGSCDHVCNGLCGEPCVNYPCKASVVKTLTCGHSIQMFCSQNPNNVRCPAPCGIKLQCGHPCSGPCSDCKQRGSHELCRHPCGRLLVCSHRCGATCSEPCPPCDKECRRRCPHGRCIRRCSEPCKPCQLPCTWSCPHGQCNNLCGEKCDRVPCNAPCPNRLLCGHPCIGLCGENCPTVCGVCQAKQLSSMSVEQRGNKEGFLQLFDCGHVKKVAEMDAWMLKDMGPDVQYRRCPECPTPITFSYRYGTHIKWTLENIEKVKTQAKGLADEAVSFSNCLATDLFRERDVRFSFTLKNQFQVICEIQRTHSVLHNIAEERWLAKDQHSQGFREIEATRGALERIEQFLEQPQLDLRILYQLYEDTRKFFLFSHVVEAENEAMRHSTAFSSIGKTRLKEARERFMAFFQGNNHALGLEWLQKIVNSLRKEVKLPVLTLEEAKDFENFPGFCRGVWKLCGQGHVYVTRLVVRSGNLPVKIDKCQRCARMEMDQGENEDEWEWTDDMLTENITGLAL